MSARVRAAWDRLAAWSDRTFGAPAELGPASALAHLKREADEANADPADVFEFADCQILLWDAARRAGHTLEDLLYAVERKQIKNEGRSWVKDAEGLHVHVRTEVDP